MENKKANSISTKQLLRIVRGAGNPILHSHYEAEILYCINGGSNVTVDGVEHHLEKGCAVVICPLTTYKNVTENADTEMFVIKLDSEFLGSSYHELASYTLESPFLSPENANVHECCLLKSIEKLYLEYTDEKIAFDWMMQGLMCEIFAQILRYMPRKKRNINGEHIFKNHIKIHKVFDLVGKEYNKNITVKEAADCAGYDHCAFCRIFKSVTGMTFHSYLNSYRINVATRLLSSRMYSVSEVAQIVGIPVAKTFSRLFKEHIGMSPSQYKGNYAKKD